MKLLLLAIILVILAIVLLGVRVLFVKGGRFPFHHGSQALRQRGVGCMRSGDR